METLATFLATGTLGPLRFGMDAETVRGILGEPDDVSVQNNPSIWKYGALELGFTRERGEAESALSFFAIYLRDQSAAIPAGLRWQGRLPAAGTTRVDFDAYLASQHLTDAATENLEWDQLVFTSGVRAVFDDGILQSLQCMRPSVPKQKQVSLSVPEEVWDAIRQEAQRLKVSPAQLCSEWLAIQAKRRDALPA